MCGACFVVERMYACKCVCECVCVCVCVWGGGGGMHNKEMAQEWSSVPACSVPCLWLPALPGMKSTGIPLNTGGLLGSKVRCKMVYLSDQDRVKPTLSEARCLL